MLRIAMSSIMRCRSGVTCTFITELLSVGLHTGAILTDEGRAACRGAGTAQCLEKLFRLRVDRCYRDNRPSRLVRALAPTAAHLNLATSLSTYSQPRPATPCGYRRRCRAMSAIGGKAEN